MLSKVQNFSASKSLYKNNSNQPATNPPAFKGISKAADFASKPLKLNDVFMDIVDDLVLRAQNSALYLQKSDLGKEATSSKVYSDLVAKYETPYIKNGEISVHLEPEKKQVDIKIRKGQRQDIFSTIYDGKDRGTLLMPKSESLPYGEKEVITNNSAGNKVTTLLHDLWDSVSSVKKAYALPDINPNIESDSGQALRLIG